MLLGLTVRDVKPLLILSVVIFALLGVPPLPSAFAAGAEDLPFQLSSSLPPPVLKALENDASAKRYALTAHLNPFYLHGDFNGDGRTDTAVLVRNSGTGKIGIAILHAGTDINARDRYGQTALMLAAHQGHEALVEMLIEHGADLNVTAKYHLSALMLAVIAGHAGIARRLVRAGADRSLQGSGAPGFAGKTSLRSGDRTADGGVVRGFAGVIRTRTV